MFRRDKVRIVDSAEICIRRKDGSIKKQYKLNNGIFYRFLCKLGLRHNCMTKYGFAEISGLLLTDVGGTAFDYIGIGTGVTPATVDDQTLETEVKRKVAVGTQVTTLGGETNDTAQLIATFSKALDALSGTSQVSEFGMLNAAIAGTLLFHIVSAPELLDWDAGDSIQVTLQVQAKQG